MNIPGTISFIPTGPQPASSHVLLGPSLALARPVWTQRLGQGSADGCLTSLQERVGVCWGRGGGHRQEAGLQVRVRPVQRSDSTGPQAPLAGQSLAGLKGDTQDPGLPSGLGGCQAPEGPATPKAEAVQHPGQREWVGPGGGVPAAPASWMVKPRGLTSERWPGPLLPPWARQQTAVP